MVFLPNMPHLIPLLGDIRQATSRDILLPMGVTGWDLGSSRRRRKVIKVNKNENKSKWDLLKIHSEWRVGPVRPHWGMSFSSELAPRTRRLWVYPLVVCWLHRGAIWRQCWSYPCQDPLAGPTPAALSNFLSKDATVTDQEGLFCQYYERAREEITKCDMGSRNWIRTFKEKLVQFK